MRKSKDEQRREAIERIVGTCIHFTGTQQMSCKAGVVYGVLAGQQPGWALRLPCTPGKGWKDQRLFELGLTEATCDKKQCPTLEEATVEEDRNEERMEQSITALRAAHEDATSKGIKKGSGGSSSLPCPVCKMGEIRYHVVSFNGHMHAKCSTPECVCWME